MATDVKYWTEARATGGGRNGVSGLVNGQLTVTHASPIGIANWGPVNEDDPDADLNWDR